MAQTEPYSLEKLYEQRFDTAERSRKIVLWKELCRSFFQRYVRDTDVVIDLGAGYCEFINNISCGKKYAVDLNEETKSFAAADVEVIMSSATDLSAFRDGTVDVVFASNLFEHLPTKDVLMEVLREIHRVLKTGGRLLVLQPNIHYAYREYWDYLDHYLPLSHVSLGEAFAIVGMRVEESRPRFLPYSLKSRLPQSAFLLRLYLALRPLHILFGRQMFLLGVK